MGKGLPKPDSWDDRRLIEYEPFKTKFASWKAHGDGSRKTRTDTWVEGQIDELAEEIIKLKRTVRRHLFHGCSLFSNTNGLTAGLWRLPGLGFRYV
jgi:hypothetical protein